jgi:hypothetical protein
MTVLITADGIAVIMFRQANTSSDKSFDWQRLSNAILIVALSAFERTADPRINGPLMYGFRK